MKKIIFVLLLIVLFSCQEQGEKEIEKETIIKEVEKSSDVKIIDKKVYPVDTMAMKFKKLMPKGSLYAGMGNGYIDVNPLTVAEDYTNGKFYWENSFDVTGATQLLDLSARVGHEVCEVLLYIKWIDYGTVIGVVADDGSKSPVKLSFGTPGINFTFQELNQGYSESINTLWVITDANGCINWRQLTTDPYDAITIDANPGVHIYQWKKAEIWLYAKKTIIVL